MPTSYFQGVAIATSIIALVILIFIRLLKKRMRKYILRSDKISKYFERD
jgi:Mg2+/Co2+ transporter CorB